MRVTSLNLNGIRAAARKGFFEWLAAERPDVACLQEIRAQEGDLTEAMRPPGYACHYDLATSRKGYAGTALYALREPDRVETGLGWPSADEDGRWLRADFGKLSVVSLYLPSGSSGPERQAVKDDFLRRFLPVLRALRRKRREFLICGDWNIAHREIDLRNWRSNQQNSGFLPHERAFLDEVFGPMGFVDAFRVVCPEPDQYTWWSNRGRAWEKNVGWRIDYQVATPGLAARARSAAIYKAARYSDHAPLTIAYDVAL